MKKIIYTFILLLSTLMVFGQSSSITTNESSGNVDDDGITCSGDEVMLTANCIDCSPFPLDVFITYNWSTGETTQMISDSPVATAIYTVTITDPNILSPFTSVETIIITVNDNPTADAGNDDTICEGESTDLTATGATDYTWSNDGDEANITVSPATTTVYTVTVTDGNGCTDSDEVTVFVNHLPNGTITESTTTICADGQITLTFNSTSGTGPYDLVIGGTIYQGIGSGDMISLTEGNDFTGTTTFVLTQITDTGVTPSCNNSGLSISSNEVTVNPLPTGTLTASPSSICPTEETTLTFEATLGTGPFDLVINGNTYSNIPDNGTISLTEGTNFTGTTTFTITQITDTGVSPNCVSSGLNINSNPVIVNPNPNSTINSSAENNTICEGEEVILFVAAGEAGYEWSTGSADSGKNLIRPNPTSNTTYFVTVTSANNCVSNSFINIQVQSAPDVTVNTPITNVCSQAEAGNSIIDFTTLVSGDAGTWAEGTNPSSVNLSDLSNVDFDGTAEGNYEFTYTVTGVPPCEDVSVTIEINVNDCSDCPIVTVVNGMDAVCSGDLTNEITDWQTSVESDNSGPAGENVFNGFIYSTVSKDAPNFPQETLPNGTSNLICNSIDQQVFAYFECDDDLDDVTDQFLAIGVFTLTVYPDAQEPTIVLSNQDANGNCSYSIDFVCDDDTADTIISPKEPGEAGGVTDVEVTTINGCIVSFENLTVPNCPSANCPSVAQVDDTESVCSGSLTNEIMDWQSDVEANPTNADADNSPLTINGFVYSITALQNASATPTPIPANIDINNTPCSNITKNVFAYLQCDENSDGTVDDYLLVGSFDLTVYPDAQEPTVVLSNQDANGDCSYSIDFVCDDDTADTTISPKEPGEAGGVTDVEVTTINGCTILFEDLTVPNCPSANCPNVVQVDDAKNVCNGGLTSEIADWQSDVEANPTNADADNSPLTINGFVYSITALQNASATPTPIPANIDINNTPCSNITKNVFAYLQCDENSDGTVDDYLLVGSFDLTVYPDAQEPTVVLSNQDANGDCSYNIDFVCDDDTADTTISPKEPGEAGGVTDVEVTTINGCTVLFEDLIVPNCPNANCPNVVQVDDAKNVCNGGLTSEITNWKSNVEANPTNADADNSPLTINGFVYSVTALQNASATPTPIPANIDINNTPCSNITKNVFAYLQCDENSDGTVDDYLLVGSFDLTVYPDAQEPEVVLSSQGADGDCSYSIDFVCGDDTEGGTTNISNLSKDPGEAGGVTAVEVTTINGCTVLFEDLIVPNCPNANCPNVAQVDDAKNVCSGGLTTEIADWQNNVETNSTNVDANNSPLTINGFVYSITALQNASATPTPIPENIDNNNTACNNITKNVFAYLQCDEDNDGIVDDYLLVGSFDLTVYPNAQEPEIELSGQDANGDCSYTIDFVCGDDTEGTDTNISNLSRGPGEAGGVTAVEVTTINGCTVLFEDLTVPNCPSANCPSVAQVDDTKSVCSGGLTTEITNWQGNVEANPTNVEANNSPLTINGFVYSVTPLQNASATPTPIPGNIDNNNTTCNNLIKNVFAYLQCDENNDGTVDDYLLVGSFDLTVYPNAQEPEIELSSQDINGNCNYTIDFVCDGDTEGPSTNISDLSKGPGEAGGLIDVEVTTINGCTISFEDLTVPNCPSANCPSVVQVDDAKNVCSGDLTTEIINWKSNVENNPTNAAANDGGLTIGGFVYSITPLQNTSATPVDIPANIDINNNLCNNITKSIFAYLQCDADGNGSINNYLLVGSFDLTVYPDAQEPEIDLFNQDENGNCTYVIDFVCPEDSEGGSTNIGDFVIGAGVSGGTTAVEVLTNNGCNETFTGLSVPNCPNADCPSVAQVDANTPICHGGLKNEINDWQVLVESNSMNIDAFQSNLTVGEYVYSIEPLQNASATAVAIPNNIDLNSNLCNNKIVSVFAYLQCDSDSDGIRDDYLLVGQFNLTVYAPARSPIIQSTQDEDTGICTYSIDFVCDNDEEGSNTNVEDSTNPAGTNSSTTNVEVVTENGCTNTFSLTVPPCPNADCPSVELVDGQANICHDGLNNEISDWQGLVESNSTNMIAFQNTLTVGEYVYSIEPLQNASATAVTIPNNVDLNSNLCNNKTVNIFAYLQCDSDNDGVRDDYLLVGQFNLTVYAPARSPIIQSVQDEDTGVCTYSLDFVCDNDEEGSSTNVGGSTNPAGTNSSTTNVEVLTENGCTNTFSLTIPTCPNANCPSVAQVDANASICHDGLSNEISNWQGLVESNTTNLSAFQSALTVGEYVYSIEPLQNANATASAIPNNIDLNSNLCNNKTVSVFAYLQCDSNNDGVRDDYLPVGQFNLTVYAPARSPIIQSVQNQETGVCTYTIDFTCENDQEGSNTNVEDSTNPAGTNSSATNVEVVTENGCTDTFSLTVPPCPNAACPNVELVDGQASICHDGLTNEINKWQDLVESNDVNMSAFQSPLTVGEYVYSIEPLQNASATAVAVPNNIDLNSNLCNNKTVSVFAYLQCDSDNDGVRDDYLPVGQFNLTVYAPSRSPIIQSVQNQDTGVCTYSIDFVCDNDEEGSSTNVQGLMNTAGTNSSTTDIEVVTENGCTDTFSLTVPPCPNAACPNVELVDGQASICHDGLTNEISNWQDLVESNDVNMSAFQSPLTVGEYVYSIEPLQNANATAVTIPNNVDLNSNLCNNKTVSVFAYLQCDSDNDGVRDDYLLVGQFKLIVYAPARSPIVQSSQDENTGVCTYSIGFVCDNDQEGNNTSIGSSTNPAGTNSSTTNVEVVTANGCTDTFSVTIPPCPNAACPSVAQVDANASICNDGLSNEISNWQGLVENNSTNSNALQSPLTVGGYIYSIEPLQNASATAVAIPNNIDLNSNLCNNKVVSVFAYLQCDSDNDGVRDDYLPVGQFNLTVYAPARSPIIQSVQNQDTGVCMYSIDFVCNNDQEGSSTNVGNSTNPAGTNSSVTNVEVITENGCVNTFSLTVPPCPNAACPSVELVDGQASICHDGLSNEIDNWKGLVESNGTNTIASQSSLTVGGYVYSIEPLQTAGATAVAIPNNIDLNSNLCNNKIVNIFAYLQCDSDNNGVRDDYLLVGQFNLTVYAPARSPIIQSVQDQDTGICAYSIDFVCNNDQEGSSTDLGNSTNPAGTNSSTTNVEVITENGCINTFSLTVPPCPNAACPNVAQVDANASICHDGLSDEIDNWQGLVESNSTNSMAFQSTLTIGGYVYSIEPLQNAGATAVAIPNNIDLNSNLCNNKIVSVFAYLQCDSDNDGIRDDYLLVGQFNLTVYAPARSPIIQSVQNEDTGVCTYSLDFVCDNDQEGGDTSVEGSTNPAGTNSSTTNVEVITENGCMNTFSLTVPPCPNAACPSIELVDGQANVCHDGLSNEIGNWQGLVESNETNSIAFQSNLTVGEYVYSIEPLQNASAVAVAIPNNIDLNSNLCNNKIVNVFAYLQCDSDNDGIRDDYLLVGQFNLTVYAPARSPIIQSIQDEDTGVCTYSLDFVCDNDQEGGDTSVEGSTNSAGTSSKVTTVEVVTANGCTDTFSLTVPPCPNAACPSVSQVDASASICHDGLSNEISNWQGLVENNSINSTAFQSNLTIGEYVYSLEPLQNETAIPVSIPEDIDINNSECDNKIVDIFAYLRCDFNGDEVIDDYLLVGRFDLTVYASPKEPSIAIENQDENGNCAYRINFICSTDAEGGSTDINNISRAAGSTGGNADVEVITANGCSTLFSNLTVPNCPSANCPNVEQIESSLSICHGELSIEIIDWQNSVENNPTNTFANNSSLTTGFVYSLEPLQTANATIVPIPEDIDVNPNECDNQFEVIYAYLECDFDGVAGVDDYLLVGQFELTVFPEPQQPTIIRNQGDNECTYSIVFKCSGDAEGSTTDMNAETVPLGTAGGEVDVEVITPRGCVKMISTPREGCTNCPKTNRVSGEEDICSTVALLSSIDVVMDWQTNVETSNSSAFNENVTGNYIYSIVSVGNPDFPQLIDSNTALSESRCRKDTKTVYAYLECDSESDGNIEYLSLGEFRLNIFPVPKQGEGFDFDINESCPPVTTSFCMGADSELNILYSRTSDGVFIPADQLGELNTGEILFYDVRIEDAPDECAVTGSYVLQNCQVEVECPPKPLIEEKATTTGPPILVCTSDTLVATYTWKAYTDVGGSQNVIEVGYPATINQQFFVINSSEHIARGYDGYFVEVTYTNSCQPDTVSQAFKADPHANIENQLSIYPNPSEGQFKLSLEHKQKGSVQIKVYDLLGRQLADWRYNKEETQFAADVIIPGRRSGIYVIEVSLENGQKYLKKVSVF